MILICCDGGRWQLVCLLSYHLFIMCLLLSVYYVFIFTCLLLVCVYCYLFIMCLFFTLPFHPTLSLPWSHTHTVPPSVTMVLPPPLPLPPHMVKLLVVLLLASQTYRQLTRCVCGHVAIATGCDCVSCSFHLYTKSSSLYKYLLISLMMCRAYRLVRTVPMYISTHSHIYSHVNPLQSYSHVNSCDTNAYSWGVIPCG